MATCRSSVDADAERIVRLIDSLQLSLSNEKKLQAELGCALDGAGVLYMAECRLGPGDCVDFLVRSGLAIECKLRAGRRQIYRQLCRYAAHDRVAAVLLVTNTAMGLPETIKGKPVYYASLGGGWL